MTHCVRCAKRIGSKTPMLDECRSCARAITKSAKNGYDAFMAKGVVMFRKRAKDEQETEEG